MTEKPIPKMPSEFKVRFKRVAKMFKDAHPEISDDDIVGIIQDTMQICNELFLSDLRHVMLEEKREQKKNG